VAARRRGALRLALAVAATVLVVDQATKAWAASALHGRTIHIVWTLRLALTHNSGIAFGQAKGRGGLSGVLAVAAVAVLLVVARRSTDRLATVGAGLIAGGAVGNLLDRLFRDGPGSGLLHGAVVDFIDLRWWPVFNVADVGVTLGAVALLVAGMRAESAASRVHVVQAPDGGAAGVDHDDGGHDHDGAPDAGAGDEAAGGTGAPDAGARPGGGPC
jgi:signal peptidase II